jgi:hypothetical protein
MASDAYATRFRKEMDDHDSPPGKPGNAKQDGKRPAAPPPLNMEHALQSQALWDATMAFSLAEYLTRHPDSRIVQVNGSFHSSARLGTVEQLLHYRPQARAIVVTIVPSAKPLQFKGSEMQKEGDFVVVTDEALIKAEPAPAAIKKEPTPAAARK